MQLERTKDLSHPIYIRMTASAAILYVIPWLNENTLPPWAASGRFQLAVKPSQNKHGQCQKGDRGPGIGH